MFIPTTKLVTELILRCRLYL